MFKFYLFIYLFKFSSLLAEGLKCKTIFSLNGGQTLASFS